MLTSLTLEGYRGFKKFTLKRLGRVNLFVGMNNSGKTSVLEAIQLLLTNGFPKGVSESLSNRGEIAANGGQDYKLLAGFLFNGRRADSGKKIVVSAINDGIKQEIVVEIGKEKNLIGLNEIEQDIIWFKSSHPKSSPFKYEISSTGAIDLKDLALRETYFVVPENKDGLLVSIPADTVDGEFVASIWPHIVLKREQETVTDALRTIDPTIESFTVLGRGNKFPKKSDTLVKLKDIAEPVPIGNLGEGVFRLLGLFMGLVRAKNSVLLVDDIDTGLHYSVMEKMWQMIFETATKLNVQVFATTHSLDCVASIAAICRDDPGNENASVHRINPKYDTSTFFTEQEIIQVAENRMDIR